MCLKGHFDVRRRDRLPDGASGKELASQCRRHKRGGFDPWVGKIPWRRGWKPSLVYWSEEFPWTEESGGLQTNGSHSQTLLKRLSMHVLKEKRK